VVTDPQRVVAVFLAAVEVADESEREALLDRECGEDRAFRKQVYALLRPDKSISATTPEPRVLTAPDAGNNPVGSNRDFLLSLNSRPEEKANRDEAIKLDFLEPTDKPGYLGRLCHYDILDVIGRGGFGFVLKALDDKLQRIVAIKVLPLEMAIGSNAHKRFLREARAAGAIRHENVVQVYAVEEKPVFFLVMEFIPGGSLQQRLDNSGPFSLEDTIRIGTQLARGLAAAHDAGLVHRDIKPANILLESGPDLRVKITDFGLARGNKDISLTQTGWVLGTPMFMAPEQAFGYVVDHRADLFSFGSVLYTMLSGKTPFPDGTADKVLRSVTRDMPTPLEEVAPDAPQWLCDIVAKLHAKEPEDRFQSAGEVVQLLENRKGPMPHTVPSMAPDQKTERIEIQPRPLRAQSKWRKHTVVIASLGILSLAVLCISGVFNAAEPAAKQSGDKSAAASENNTLEVPNNKFTNSLQMEFALIPKGKSWLGGRGGSPGEKEIDVAADFYMGVYEVTREEWEKVMGDGKNASQFSRAGKQEAMVRKISDADLRRFPIDSVSWNDCQQFVSKVNQAMQEDGWVYRMPTSVEWEYACRGGPMASRDESRFDFYLDEPTNTLPPGKANFDSSGLKRPCKVGSYPPNKLGLHDMHGNVFEYCSDIVKEKNESLRFLAGGAWIDNAGLCGAEHRGIGDTRSAYTGGGLRLVRVPATGVQISVKDLKK
jgi:serine/threonine protein kinase